MRRLGRSGIEVSDIAIGTWAIGGPFFAGDMPSGWGAVDDEESVRTIHAALDAGVTLIDTADVYGAGHAERVVGRAVAGRRDRVVVATKWGNVFDEETKQILGADSTAAAVRPAAEASLRRLDTDHIDLLQLHLGGLAEAEALDLVPELERLVDDGLIRAYGWSTDEPGSMRAFAAAGRASAVQHTLNVMQDTPEMLALANEADLGELIRGPLAMGLLTDKINADTVIGPDDVRGRTPDWMKWFKDGRPVPAFLEARDSVREVLTEGGRTLAQGALAWILARSPRTIPLAGMRTVPHVRENTAVLQQGPLRPEQMDRIAAILASAEG